MAAFNVCKLLHCKCVNTNAELHAEGCDSLDQFREPVKHVRTSNAE